jgi:hypothetical protein
MMTMPARLKFEEEAQRWEETGGLQACGNNKYAFTGFDCWMRSDGGKQDGASELLLRYHAAAQENLNRRLGADWYETLMRTRDYCSECGETFRIENLSFCTHCTALFGYCHSSIGGRAANGNPKCPRCGVGEIVG